ncbi:hypothetical protein PYW07_014683 [Mythimna separata]|uniref:C2H2-type domain-containing protein n=1 Tax=Mythimna separata TaxID=271217 RepID=A0AAD7YYT2_MYTSE|nr:hypothetical protein PYW07_014683 [Mythimna separata]
MDEINPLLICPTPSLGSYGGDLNKGGRPAKNSVLKFGLQPRSMMAKMLSEMKTKPKSVGHFMGGELIIIEDEPSDQIDLSQDIAGTIKSEEYVCLTCSHRSCNEAEHKKHSSSHQLLYCDFPKCSYSCKLSSNLIKHKRVHTNEKPYLCDRCSFRTNFVNSLKAHKRLHTAEKPYQCSHCNYRCNSSSNLKKHCHLRHSEGNKCKYKGST